MHRLVLAAALAFTCSAVLPAPKGPCEEKADKSHRDRVKECNAQPQPDKGKCQSASMMTYKADMKGCKAAKK